MANIFFYLIIFILGITFGSFYTLAIYRIPLGKDILHTRSACPKCKHKLYTIDLIPVFSFLYSGGKCRYCKQKISPNYFITEVISGLIFVLLAVVLKLDAYNLTFNKVFAMVVMVFYFSILSIIAGIDRDYKTIDKEVLFFGLASAVAYIIYLYVVENTNIYRYAIYLMTLALFLIIDTLILKKKAYNSYILKIALLLIMMEIFTSAEIALISSIVAAAAIILFGLIRKALNNRKNLKKEERFFENIPFGYILCYTHIFVLIAVICFFNIM